MHTNFTVGLFRVLSYPSALMMLIDQRSCVTLISWLITLSQRSATNQKEAETALPGEVD